MAMYTPRKGDTITHQGETLVVKTIDAGMVEFRGNTTTGRINISTWQGMWTDARDKQRGPA